MVWKNTCHSGPQFCATHPGGETSFCLPDRSWYCFTLLKTSKYNRRKEKTEYNSRVHKSLGIIQFVLFLSERQFWNHQPPLCSYIAVFDLPDRQVETTLYLFYTTLCLQSIAFIVKLDCQKVWNVKPCQVCVSHLPACCMRKCQGSKKENQPGWQNVLC